MQDSEISSGVKKLRPIEIPISHLKQRTRGLLWDISSCLTSLRHTLAGSIWNSVFASWEIPPSEEVQGSYVRTNNRFTHTLTERHQRSEHSSSASKCAQASNTCLTKSMSTKYKFDMTSIKMKEPGEFIDTCSSRDSSFGNPENCNLLHGTSNRNRMPSESLNNFFLAGHMHGKRRYWNSVWLGRAWYAFQICPDETWIWGGTSGL